MNLSKQGDLVLILALAGGAATLLLLPVSNEVVGLVCALLLVLVLPGYAVTTALFPGNEVELPVRLIFIIGLSLMVTALSGLLLNLTPGGLVRGTWAGYLFGITLSATVLALIHRHRRALTAPAIQIPFQWEQGVLLALAMIVTLLALSISATPAPSQGLEGYTLLGVNGDRGGVDPPELALTVRSEEFTTLSYKLQVDVDGHLQEGPSFQLRPGERWEGRLVLPEEVENAPVTISLYRLDNPDQIYRHVVWQPETSNEEATLYNANSDSQ